MNLTFIDTETTWIEQEDVIIQLWLINEVDWKVIQRINSFFSNWERKISLKSKATHGILEDSIKNFPIFSPLTPEYKLINNLSRTTIFVGHNIQFDIGMLAKSWLKIDRYIDTLQVAKHLMQDEEDEFENSYRQEILKYYLMEKWIVFPDVKAHDAMGDTQIVEVIFGYLFELTKNTFALGKNEEAIDKMLELTQTPILLKKIRFGKHRWQTFEQIAQNDPSYLQWLAWTTDDENIRFTCERWINI